MKNLAVFYVDLIRTHRQYQMSFLRINAQTKLTDEGNQ